MPIPHEPLCPEQVLTVPLQWSSAAIPADSPSFAAPFVGRVDLLPPQSVVRIYLDLAYPQTPLRPVIVVQLTARDPAIRSTMIHKTIHLF